MPNIIQQQISVIGKEVVNLVLRVHDKRIKSALANEKYIARGGVEEDSENEDETNQVDMEDDFEDVNEEGIDDEEFDDLDSNEEDYDEEDLERCGLFDSAIDT
jgi:hypothetical protein